MKKTLLLVIVLLLFQAGLCSSAEEALVLHLKFDEGSGEVARDSSGRGHDARLVQPVWEEFGLQGKALRLNGENAYIELPLHEDFDQLRNFTFSLWFKAEKYEHGMSLFSRGDYNTGWSTYIFRSFIALSGKQLEPAAVLYTPFTAGSKPILPFYHLVITGEPSPGNPEQMSVRYYVNGKLRTGKHGLEAFQTGAFLPSPKQPVSIGKYGSGSNRWFNGILDEVKIYRRTLSAAEIATLHQQGLQVAAAAGNADIPVLQAVEFAPLQKKRLAIYELPPEYGIQPVRSLEWFEEQARANGLQTTRLNNRDIRDSGKLNPENFDTLLLPVDLMPLECEDSIFQFLAGGGNLITVTIVPSVFKLDEDGEPLTDDKGNIVKKQHTRGWFAPFLLRHLDPSWDWPVRIVREPLALNPAVAPITGDCLPAQFEADPKIRYTPADTWNNVAGGDGNYGAGANFAQAADLKIDLYRERNGVGSDFITFRYYNNLIFGATFVELGRVGSKLLQSENGDKIFRGILHLLESKLPGEQPETYYRDIVKLHQAWSDFGFTFFDTLAALRDAGIAALLKGEDYARFNQSIADVEQRFADLSQRRKAQQLKVFNKAQQPQLFNQGSADEISREVQSLLADTATADAAFKGLQSEARQMLSGIQPPAPVKVQHKYGTIPSIASLTLPTNLSRMRGRLFQTLREIGVNVYSGPFHSWYAADRKVRENLGDIMRDHKFVYPASARYIAGGGVFNPSNGTITEHDAVDYPFEAIRKHLQNIFSDWEWKGKGNFRIGAADETGLGYQYWGEAAAGDLRNHLRTYYQNDLKAMNAHCGTSFSDFAEVKLPLRKPETPAEHAIWEHWRRCREAKLESLYANFLQISKSLNPELDVFQMPSTGAKQSPLYGVNYYNATKYQDVNAIDGTCCGINDEWLYTDLTRIRTLTSEWGGLYSESAPAYVNSKLWEELSGGALGFEQHVWCFGSDSVSFVDPLDMPRIYGNLLRMTLRDARKIDHLILDGQRATPEIGILFSQTTRVHDQGWGWNGEKTLSDHMQTVSNYYELFLKYHRSARVIPEEMLVEDTLPEVSVLILPQTRFLDEKVQQKLLAYVARGGILISEGRCGEFDSFGQKSNLLFRETGIVPSFTGAKELTLGSKTIPVPGSDRIFSPAGPGDSLASFGTDPAIRCVSHGKGKIVVLGFNPGLHRYAALPAISEYVLRQVGVTPKFMLQEDQMVLREWVYGPDTYLILTSRASNWALQEITLKIRGQVVLEDYLFGKSVPGQYQDGYTAFKTLAVNGGRIFRIPGARLAGTRENPALFEEAKKHPLQFTLGESSGTTDNYQAITLPFQGRLSDSGPLKYQDYVFSLTTLSSGNDANKGEMYLSISKDSETQKKHLSPAQDYYFRFRERIFKIRSTRNFYMYPFYCDLSIEEVTAAPEGALLELKKKTSEIEFSNSLIAFTLDSSRGAAVTSLRPVDEKTEQVYSQGRCHAASGLMPGPFADQPFEMLEREKTADSLTAEFFMKTPSGGKELRQTVGLRRDCAGFTVSLACRNVQQLEQAFDLRWHPKLVIGNAADTADFFFIPSGDVVQEIPFRALSAGHGLPPSQNWAAIVDRRQKLAYVTTFRKEQVHRVYVWEANQFYTFEIFAPKTTIKPNEVLPLDLGFYLLRGLSGVDAWQDGIAVFAGLPPFLNQSQPVSIEIQAASVFGKVEKAVLGGELWQQGKKIRDLGRLEQTLAFDLPVAWQLSPDLGDLPDGDYELRVSTAYGQHPVFTTRKPCILSGRTLADLLKDYQRCSAELLNRKNLPSATLFSQRVLLEECRRAIAEGKVSNARQLLAEFRQSSSPARPE